MTTQRYRLMLDIPVEVTAETGVQTCLCDAKSVLESDGYNDGRLPFFTEMFTHALCHMLRHVVSESVFRMMELKHGKGMMQLDERTQVNKAYHAAQEWIENDFKNLSVGPEGWRVEIASVDYE